MSRYQPSSRLVGRTGLALACLLGCKDSTGGGSGSNPPPPVVDTLAFVGGDISALQRIESAGGVFKDSGKAGDAIAILHAHGSTGFRLRVFVAPNDSDVQVNDLPYTIQLAKRVKAAGAKFLLDFHYSDTWADPGHQTKPAAWAALPFDSLVLRVESYTAGVIAQLKQAGALPDIVQLGNEIDGGMLWPDGEVGGAYDNAAQWDKLRQLLEAAIQGVKDSLGTGDTVRIMLHYSLGGNSAGTQWFFDHITAQGVPYDLIGLSYYPWWHGTLGMLKSNLQATAQRYGKDIMVVETGYPWRAGGWESMVTDSAAMIWAATPAGQTKFLTDLVAAVGATPGKHGSGVIWWYPESIQVPGLFAWGGGSLALFDATGNLLPAASVFPH